MRLHHEADGQQEEGRDAEELHQFQSRRHRRSAQEGVGGTFFFCFFGASLDWTIAEIINIRIFAPGFF